MPPCRNDMVAAAGSRWHFVRMGSGRPMLLVHGTAASTHSWRDLMPLLAEHYDVLAIDLPGHGKSTPPAGGSMSLPSIASGLGEALRNVDFAPRYAIGHSAGAAIVLRMALNKLIRPEFIIGLNAALLPFGGGMQRLLAPLANFFANTRLMPRLIAYRARDINAVKRVLAGTGSILDSDGIACYQQLLQRPEHVSAVLSMMASWELEPLLADIEALEPRLHLVTGLRDKAVSPREADSIAGLLQGTRVTHLDGCGHLAHEEKPHDVSRLIADICSGPGVFADACN